MIYVTGDGFAAASYAATTFSWASQDPNHYILGKSIHPANRAVSFPVHLSKTLHCSFNNDAFQKNSHNKIFRDIHQALETPIRYLVVTWPNFYRSEIEFEDNLYQFEFNQIGNISSGDLQQIMTKQMIQFNLDHALTNFNQQLKELVEVLDSKNISYVFVASDSKFDTGIGRWLFDQSIIDWASPKNYLNGAGYLNAAGHKELAKLLTLYLTNQ